MSQVYGLNQHSLPELKEIAQKLGLPARRSKSVMISDIAKAFQEYEEYKKEKLDKYTRHGQLGQAGKEGTTYLVTSAKGKQLAMKTFRPKKSSDRLKTEYKLQKMAYKKGVAPKPYDYDIVSKYIVMEKMDHHFFQEQRRQVTKAEQERIIELFNKLDEAKVYHNDANLYNYMVKEGQIYLIDYGFAREITPSLVKKLGTDRPNYVYMTVGLVIKLKELGFPERSYRHILAHVAEPTRKKFDL